jgi:hypothetical protein
LIFKRAINVNGELIIRLREHVDEPFEAESKIDQEEASIINPTMIDNEENNVLIYSETEMEFADAKLAMTVKHQVGTFDRASNDWMVEKFTTNRFLFSIPSERRSAKAEAEFQRNLHRGVPAISKLLSRLQS